MNIVVLDNDEKAIKQTFNLIKCVVPDANVYGTVNKNDLLLYMMNHKVDICFVTVVSEKRQEIFAFAKKLKGKYSRLNMIFLAEGNEGRGLAMDMKASGYLLKPVDMDMIRLELSNLRYAV